MRIIDFHAHAFPDQIAEKAISTLEGGSDVPATTDGTIDGLLRLMDQHGVEKAVIASIATKPAQAEPILKWSREIASDRIIPFGSVHPESEDFAEEVRRIAEAGLPGVKLHPLYQKFNVDEERVFPLYEAISEAGLILLMHAGYDIAFADDDEAAPSRFAPVLDAFPDLKLVMAHFGGWKWVDQFIESLLGRNVYIDTSFTRGYATQHQIDAIMNGHPTDHILFGSDSPWGRMDSELAFVDELPVSENTKAEILHANAEALLESAPGNFA